MVCDRQTGRWTDRQMKKVTYIQRMKALRLRHKEADPEFMKKENERISLLQKRQRASMNEEELTAAREYN